MKYTNYFSFYLKNYKVPDLDRKQWERLLNIVFMEALMTGSYKNGNGKYNAESTYRKRKSLNELTKRKKPHYLVDEMIYLSKKSKSKN